MATLSIGPYLLLEGTIPTATLYPKRLALNNRRIHFYLLGLRSALCTRMSREDGFSRPASGHNALGGSILSGVGEAEEDARTTAHAVPSPLCR